MKVFFRVDASKEIGTGHVIRCITLAKELKKQGANCIVLSRDHDGNLFDYIQDNGFDLKILKESNKNLNNEKTTAKPDLIHSHWLGVSQIDDATQSITAMGTEISDWLVVDHYGIDYRWHEQMRSHCKNILVIDDLADRKHDCDLLLDQNLVVSYKHRYDKLIASQTTKLLGPSFAVLQNEYANVRMRIRSRKITENILVYFGGSDLYNLTETVLDILLRISYKGKVTLVLDSKNHKLALIRDKIKDKKNYEIYNNLPSLADILVDVDIAIGAGGTATWERCALGVPSFVITVAENQKQIAAEMHKQGYIKLLGNYDDINLSILEKTLNDIANNRIEIEEWSQHCLNLVDGLGTKRVAEIFTLDEYSKLDIRYANYSDKEILFEWRNEADVRNNSFSNHEIKFDEHCKWLDNVLKNRENNIFYILSTALGFPLGQVRFSLSNNGWVLDYSLRVDFRGKKLAKKLLSKALQAFSVEQPDKFILARVLTKNLPSQNVIKSLGFKEVEFEGDSIMYRVSS